MRFIVSIFCDSKVYFNVREESIQNFTLTLLVDATLFDKNSLTLCRLVNSPCNVGSLPSSFLPSVPIFFKVLPTITLKEILDFELMLDYS